MCEEETNRKETVNNNKILRIYSLHCIYIFPSNPLHLFPWNLSLSFCGNLKEQQIVMCLDFFFVIFSDSNKSIKERILSKLLNTVIFHKITLSRNSKVSFFLGLFNIFLHLDVH